MSDLTKINGEGFNINAIQTHLQLVREESFDPDLRTVIRLAEDLIKALLVERAAASASEGRT